MPEARIGDDLLGLLDCPQCHEIQTCIFHLLFEEGVGDHRGAVAAPVQRGAQFNYRMHVTGAADRRQQYFERAGSDRVGVRQCSSSPWKEEYLFLVSSRADL